MKTVRLCAVGALAALALAAGGPAGAESSDNASCVGQFSSNPAPPQGEDFGQKTANAATMDSLHPFGETSVSPLAQAPRDACPTVP